MLQRHKNISMLLFERGLLRHHSRGLLLRARPSVLRQQQDG
jgi:hypothetical protein